MNNLRTYKNIISADLLLHDAADHIDPFTDPVLAEHFTKAYLEFIRKLIDLTYHAGFSPAEEAHLRELFEEVLRTHAKLR